MSLETMDGFFTARADNYDAHMITAVEGCREGYAKMAEQVALHYAGEGVRRAPLLDLGCGTGLELQEIFARLPDLPVTAIDLTEAMLVRLRAKFPDKDIRAVCGSYFDVDFEAGAYGCAVSFQTMHHFDRDRKTALYRRVREALAPGGVYLECDYMVESQEEEDFYFAENARLRCEQKIARDAFFHYDTPCTIENQIAMLKDAGFRSVDKVFRMENTTMLSAKRD